MLRHADVTLDPTFHCLSIYHNVVTMLAVINYCKPFKKQLKKVLFGNLL